MTFKERLNELKNNNNRNILLINQLQQEKKEEIEKIEKKFKKEMQSLLENKEISENQYNEYCKKIYEHSIFNKDIINAMVQIVSIFEGENYEYLIIKYFPRNSQSLCITANVIVLENTLSIYERYDENEIDKLLEERKLIILDRNDIGYKSDEIGYFKWKKDDELIENINFEKFSYLKKFIDLVIDYKIHNEKLELTLIEIENLIYNFIMANELEINVIYHTKKEEEDQEISLIQSKNTARRKRLSKILEKNI